MLQRGRVLRGCAHSPAAACIRPAPGVVLAATHASLLPRLTAPLAPVRSVNARRKEEEEANAVEKRGHMGDFYRNLLRRWGPRLGRVGQTLSAPCLAAGWEQAGGQLSSGCLCPASQPTAAWP